VQRIVLPITSRGLVVTDRVCWAILGVAMVVAAALILYLNRGTTFFVDQITFLYTTPGLSIGNVLDPHNGHLILTTRLAFKAILETIGAEYVAFRLLAVGALLLSAGFFYALVKRRIGALPALAPAFVLLFLGSAWQHVIGPIGFTPVFSIAAGLAALLFLERGDRRGDIAACAVLVVSIASYTTGLPFLVGTAISVLLRPDRRQRAWIFLGPLVLYAAWWLWSLSTDTSSESETTLSNVLLIPSWTAESLAVAIAAVTGLGFDFQVSLPLTIDPSWGRVLAVAFVIALVLRFRRGNVPLALWTAIGIALTWWALGGIAYTAAARTPESVRYIYMGAVAVMLVAAEAGRSTRFSRLGLVVLFGACAVSLATNIFVLRDAGNYMRAVSATTRAEFAMIEIARDHVDPSFEPAQAVASSPTSLVVSPAGAYLAVVDRYGSPAIPISELLRAPESDREHADRVLAAALGIHLERRPSSVAAHGCARARLEPGSDAIAVELPPKGAILRANGSEAAPVKLRRFADLATADLGRLPASGASELAIPLDRSTEPWEASVAGVGSVTVCALR
jgi:hypothetical protein